MAEGRGRAIPVGRAASALACAIALAGPAAATELYCLGTTSLNWNIAPSVLIGSAEDEHGFNGWFEFWLDTDDGSWSGRNIGSAALYSDGGTYTIASDGTGYRDHWVGVDAEAGRETLHIALEREPMTFLRVTRDGFADAGTCLDTTGRRFIDGREITE